MLYSATARERILSSGWTRVHRRRLTLKVTGDPQRGEAAPPEASALTLPPQAASQRPCSQLPRVLRRQNRLQPPQKRAAGWTSAPQEVQWAM